MKYAFWMTVTGGLLISMNLVVFYFYVKENYLLLVRMSPMDEEVKQQLFAELYHIFACLSGFSFLFIIVVSIIGIIISHRTAGPMYNFKQVFQKIQNGELKTRIQLRKHDEFQDVAIECNKMLDHLLKKRSEK